MCAKGGQVRRRGSYPLLLGEIRDLLTDVFHYSILHLLSVATERVTNGHLVKQGLPDRTGLSNEIFCHVANV